MGKYLLRRNIKINIYFVLAALFWFIRQVAIPNPFEVLGEGIPIIIGEVSFLLTPDILNWIADPVIGAITFIVVGLYYIKRSDPALGSILYMIFYAVHIGLLYLLLWVYPIVWLMVLIVGIYIGLHIVAVILNNNL